MSNVMPFPSASGSSLVGQGVIRISGGGTSTPVQVGFERLELQKIMDLYGRMVAAGHWRDYAIDMGREAAVFSAFRRSAERPEFRIEKRPALRHRQGMWALFGEAGQVLKRGSELPGILAPVERRLLKIVGD